MQSKELIKTMLLLSINELMPCTKEYLISHLEKLNFAPNHVTVVLEKLRGQDPDKHPWDCDKAGRYRLN